MKEVNIQNVIFFKENPNKIICSIHLPNGKQFELAENISSNGAKKIEVEEVYVAKNRSKMKST